MGQDTNRLARLDDAPPSAKLVYKTLEYEGALTQGQLIEETLLAPRTVRHALTELEDRGVVREDVYFADARKRLYSLQVEIEDNERSR